jgi:DNA-binding SARP family transcriptional activator
LTRVRIQLCGRVAVSVDDRRVEDGMPGRQGRLVFVYLVLNRLRPVAREELVEAVWASPPNAADAAVRSLLSKLRPALWTDALDGTRLSVPDESWIDVEAAREAAHRAESAAALEEWVRAWSAAQVALFAARRGFLPGEDAPWIDEQRRELEQLRLRALECYSAAGLGLGGTELAAAERGGRELIGLAPYRETGYRFLMQALAAQGNVAEALRVYDDLRQRLRDELGIAPSEPTKALHATLVRG